MNKNNKAVKVGGAVVALGAAFGVGIPIGKSISDNAEITKYVFAKEDLESIKSAIETNANEIQNLEKAIKEPNAGVHDDIEKLKEHIGDMFKTTPDNARPLNDLSNAITKNSDALKKEIQEVKKQISDMKQNQFDLSEVEAKLDINNFNGHQRYTEIIKKMEEYNDILNLNDELWRVEIKKINDNLWRSHEFNKKNSSYTKQLLNKFSSDFGIYQQQTQSYMMDLTHYIVGVIGEVEESIIKNVRRRVEDIAQKNTNRLIEHSIRVHEINRRPTWLKMGVNLYKKFSGWI